MKIDEKLQLLRKKNGYTQEELADKLGIARQTISKWENGQAVPELSGLIALSELYGVTIDRIVKEEDGCNIPLETMDSNDIKNIIPFLVRAKQSSYAGKGNEVESSRVTSHDFQYEEGVYLYYDTYLGGSGFAGEEAVWQKGNPVWSMNYVGRVLGENFDLDFLREVLYHVPVEMPYRGPAIYSKGDYRYHCKVDGTFEWYQGYEEIFFLDQKVYECYFQGGEL